MSYLPIQYYMYETAMSSSTMELLCHGSSRGPSENSSNYAVSYQGSLVLSKSTRLLWRTNPNSDYKIKIGQLDPSSLHSNRNFDLHFRAINLIL